MCPLIGRPPGRSRDPGRDEAGDNAPDTSLMARGLAALEDAVQIIREQLADAQQRANEAELKADTANERATVAQALADRALAQLTDAVARADQAEAATAGERQRADVLCGRLDTARQASQSALQAADELRRADEARKARRLLGRLRAALRGE
jgi:hypothetical protein